MNKPVVRSPLDRLPLHQKQLLAAWLSTGGNDGIGMTYTAAKARLKAQFGISTSITALHEFYRRQNRIAQPPRPQVEASYDPHQRTHTIIIHLPR
jgi:hypothetical protein